ncbi:MAG: helix-turn-helix transcriptional regulator [Proteobacteria bacterium]|nr:helix-turn-helix transcriptional regulator [Pseudomonadota bacterium]
MNYNQLFRLSRIMQGKTQSEVGAAAGVTHQAVNAFEKGSASLSMETLRKMAISININPDYLIDPSVNPFLSQELIKMEFPENLFLPGLNFQIIYFLAEKNYVLELCFLFSNTRLGNKLTKLRHSLTQGTIAENPVVAIACQDANRNIFLFKRRKIIMGPILGDRELRLELPKYKTGNKSIIIGDREVSDSLLEKIRDVTVTKDELARLFNERNDVVLDEGERLIISKKREKGIAHSEILRFIDSFPREQE